MAMIQTAINDFERLPKCDTKKHNFLGEPGLNYCNNQSCPYKEKYFCYDCAEMHDHGAISYNKHTD